MIRYRCVVDARLLVAVRAERHLIAITAGWLSSCAIDPAAPRLVGRALATRYVGVAWHRVVRADGIVPKGETQLELLRREGVPL